MMLVFLLPIKASPERQKSQIKDDNNPVKEACMAGPLGTQQTFIYRRKEILYF